jgi:YVTN family beta-propeller protein
MALSARTGRAFVANSDGTASTLDAASGAVLRTVRVGRQPLTLALDEATKRVFIGNAGSGTVSVLDAGTGILRGTIKVGKQPIALGLDEPAGRLFVVNGGAGTVTILDARGSR